MSLATENKLGIKPELMNIDNIDSKLNIHTYYTGLFDPVTREEVKTSPFHTAIEDYFPLLIDVLNKRGNWRFLSTDEALNKDYINLCWSNTIRLNSKSSIIYRLILTTPENYITNKKAFYDKFKDYDFVPKYYAFSSDKDQAINLSYKRDEQQIKRKLIIKPDLGARGTNILILDDFDRDKIQEHVMKSKKYNEWTISDVYVSKLIDGYINSCRVYLLVVKNDKEINGYYYDEFMIYRCLDKFNNDIFNKRQFITNYYDPKDPERDKNFVKYRFISDKIWKNSFSDDELKIIMNKIIYSMKIICDNLKNDIICCNQELNNNVKIGFHIYGLDIIVTEDLDVKVIEINGAPSMNIKTRLYSVENRMDYFNLFDDFVELVIDPIYLPLNPKKSDNRFKKIYSSTSNENNCII